MARFSGRLDEAARHAEALQRFEWLLDDENYPWLGWAATFCREPWPAAPPASPLRSPRILPRPRRRDGPAHHRGGADRGRPRRRGPGALRRGRPPRVSGPSAISPACSTAWRSCWRVGAPRPSPGWSAPPHRPGPSRLLPPPRRRRPCGPRSPATPTGLPAGPGFGGERRRGAHPAGLRGPRRRLGRRRPAAVRAAPRHAGPAPRAGGGPFRPLTEENPSAGG